VVHASLGNVIGVRRSVLRHETDDGTNVDDTRGVVDVLGSGVLFHVRKAGTGQVKYTLEVEIENAIPTPVHLSRLPLKRFSPRGPSVVDEDVQLV